MAEQNDEENGIAKLLNQTTYQIHIRHRASLRYHLPQLLDFTEAKLLKNIKNSPDPILKLKHAALLQDYLDGKIAVCWKQGMPYFLKIKKGKTLPK